MASLTDLFEFLSSPNPSARQVALQNLIGHTPKSSPNRHIFIPSLSAPIQPSTADGETSIAQTMGGASKMTLEDERKVGVIRDLMVICKDQGVIAHDALSALVNLSDNIAVARHIAADEEYLVWLISYTANPTSPLSPLTSMLLSNLTSHPSLLASISNLSIPIIGLPKSKIYPPWYLPASASSSSTSHPDFRDPSYNLPDSGIGQEEEREIEGIRALVTAFEDGATEGVKDGKGKRKGECHFLASVFANISTVPTTRQLLLIPYPPFPSPSTSSSEHEPLLSKIVPFTSHPDTIRRGGALGTIKNISMDKTTHAFLLASEDDRIKLNPGKDQDELVRGCDVLPSVLGPLMGGEEYDIDEMDQLPPTLQFLSSDKKRETDVVLRMMCVEILLLLSTTYTGRETLRKRGTYFVIRELHKVETDQNIKDAIERLVGLLQGDEGRETKDEIIHDLVKVQNGPKSTLLTEDKEDEDDLGGEMDVIEV